MSPNAPPIRVAILAAAFNEGIVGRMLAVAQEELTLRGAVLAETVRVPGAYELPLPAQLLLQRPEVDLLVVLGFIERGETLHGEVMGQVVHRTLLELQLTSGKPMGLGIIGPSATAEQAETRKESYARAAVSAGLGQVETLRGLSGVKARVGFGRPKA